MYAVVRRYEGVTDPAEAGRQVNEGFLPLLRQVQGFVAYYWVDAGGGVMVSMSVFQDPAGAEESTVRAGSSYGSASPPCSPTLPRSRPATSWPTRSGLPEGGAVVTPRTVRVAA